MDNLLWLAVASVALLALVVLWAVRIRADWRRATKLGGGFTGAQASEPDEQVAEVWTVVYRDVFLALITIGGLTYFVVSRAGSALAALGSPTLTLGPGIGIDTIAVTERVLVSISAFLVVFGLSASFLPKFLLIENHAKVSKYISFGTAFCFAAIFALWLSTSDAPYAAVLSQITQGFLQVFATFLVLLFGAIGSFLALKRLKGT